MREYRAAHPVGYSQYCELYRERTARRSPLVLQEHKVGEKLFVDYVEQTVPVRDAELGAERAAQVFVVVLGVSSYCYAETSRARRAELARVACAHWNSSAAVPRF